MILNGECGQFNPLLLECLTDAGARLHAELSMLLPIDGELRWHHVSLCALWSDEIPPLYIGAVGQANPM